MNITEANDVGQLLNYVRQLQHGEPISVEQDTDAREAGARLADRRVKALMVGANGDEVRAAWRSPADEVEWGTRDRHGQVHSVGVENEAQARSMRSMTPVRRTVGPWSVVEPVEPKPEPVPPPPLSSDPGDWKFRGYDQMGLPAWSWAPVEPKETP